MYVPKEFSINDKKQLDAFILEHPFTTLITTSKDGFPIATHVPVVAKKNEDKWMLEGHLALANQQAQELSNNQKALCTVLGADAYISSSVYENENVPTWNYQAVHLYGQIVVLDENQKEQHLAELVQLFEKNRQKPLDYAQFSSKMVDSYKIEIIGFRLEVTKIEGAFKLSQNRNETDSMAIISDLEKCPFSGAKEIAKKMKENVDSEK